MNLFARKPQPTVPTVSTESAEQQIGWWQKHQKTAYLFGGCLVLLIAARACNSHQKRADQAYKAQHVQQQVERDQSDKDSEIAALHAQLFNAQQSIAAAKQAAETPSQNPLTPAQMQQMAAAGVGALPPPSMLAANPEPGTAAAVVAGNGTVRTNGYTSGDATPHEPSKPTTLVISYRQEETAAASSSATIRNPPETATAGIPTVQPPPSSATPTGRDPGSAEANGNPTFAATTSNPEDQQHQLAAFTGEKYRIREGTWLPCTEELRINGFFSGNINCLVSINVYSPSGTHLLMPMGTVALGHSAAVGGQNQQRLFVVFDRFIMPDGYTVTFDNAAGLDQVGQTGLRDKIDHHYTQMFGASVALAAVSGLSQIGNYGNTEITAGSQYRAGITQSLSESAVRILDRFTNILPTFVIREGARNNIHLPFNLWLPDYKKHVMKGDL